MWFGHEIEPGATYPRSISRQCCILPIATRNGFRLHQAAARRILPPNPSFYRAACTMNNIFNFKWCRAVSVVPTFKDPIPEAPAKPAKPKHVIIPWGKVPIISKGLEKKTIEQEMMKLHYIFRKMEASQRLFHDESELVLQRQKSMLDSLQFDNKVTQDKLDIFYPEDYAEEMSKLNAECKMWMDKIELEVKRVEELEGATFTLYDDEYRSRKVMGGVNAAREHGHATQIHIHILEKRVFKAMQGLTVIQWHNKLMQDEMNSLRTEHELFEELHAKMEIELQECMEQIDASINKSYELYDERHDYQKLISEILEMMEEGDAYTRWQQYGTWIGLDGRPLAETALSSEKERTERMKNKRPTLALVNENDMKKMFVIEGAEARLKFRSKPHTKKYERLIEIKAFMNCQQVLGLRMDQADEVLPELIAARDRHAQLVQDVQDLNNEIEEAIRFKLGRFADEDAEWDLSDTNDFLDIIRELKRQIFLVFEEAGCLGWDPNLESKIREDKIDEETSIEESISKLFVKTEDFISELSQPVGFGRIKPPQSSANPASTQSTTPGSPSESSQ
ncbi:outer dynein arm protein 1 [Physcomitrium patens]|uniref:outer dynein arm protein 1 n=1 Tax=Physcomitrium patens TaxID=3218 RepID=UPI000D175F9F|nr:uncharacterized protein LOC112281541 [Physcomitrium patens]|eukprot:XP_024373960.1 uncharacterized protein LOC112281541 [Physcomitrella patens]